MFELELVTPPAGYPVSVATARDRLRIDADDDDATLAGLIAAACAWVENHTGRSLLARTYRAWADAWPKDVLLPRGPVLSIEAVHVFDASDVETEVLASVYQADTVSFLPRLVLRPGECWPEPGRTANGVRIEYVAGHENTAAIPAPIIQAILLLVSHWHQNRTPVALGTIVADLPFGVEALLNDYRTWAF